MSAGVVALVVGTILAVAALAFVLYPLFFALSERAPRRESSPRAADDSAILALREIEFDRATGKLSEPDYAELKKAYSERALRELRTEPGQAPAMTEPEVAPDLDRIDALARRYQLTHRACPTCGVRPEPDAVYCSTCGTFLDRTCPRCAEPIKEPGAAFCSTCGAPLTAAFSARDSAVAATRS